MQPTRRGRRKAGGAAPTADETAGEADTASFDERVIAATAKANHRAWVAELHGDDGAEGNDADIVNGEAPRRHLVLRAGG